MKRFVFGLIALLVLSVLASSFAVAENVPVNILNIYVNGKEVSDGEVRTLARDNKIDVDVKFLATGDDDYVTVEAEISGLEHDRDKARYETDVFSIKAGNTYHTDDFEKISIELPGRMDTGEYLLRIWIKDRDNTPVYEEVKIYVTTSRHGMKIKDVIFSPAYEVEAGHALVSKVKVKNTGEKDEEDVKVTVSIPALGVSDADYIDEIESGETKTSEELWFRIPDDAESGEYDVLVSVEFNDGDDEVSETYKINVVGKEAAAEEETAEEKVIIAVSDVIQDVVAGGAGVVYPLSITNNGKAAKTFTVTATAGDWAALKVTPSTVVLQPGETRIIYVNVGAGKDAPVGEQVIGVAVKSNGEVLKELTMKVNVLPAPSSGKITLLEGILIVLIVILIIVGLVVGFSKMRKKEGEEY